MSTFRKLAALMAALALTSSFACTRTEPEPAIEPAIKNELESETTTDPSPASVEIPASCELYGAWSLSSEVTATTCSDETPEVVLVSLELTRLAAMTTIDIGSGASLTCTGIAGEARCGVRVTCRGVTALDEAIDASVELESTSAGRLTGTATVRHEASECEQTMNVIGRPTGAS